MYSKPNQVLCAMFQVLALLWWLTFLLIIISDVVVRVWCGISDDLLCSSGELDQSVVELSVAILVFLRKVGARVPLEIIVSGEETLELSDLSLDELIRPEVVSANIIIILEKIKLRVDGYIYMETY